MFFVLSKIAAFVSYPATWIVAVFVVSLLVRKRKALRKRLTYIGIGMVIFFTNPLIARWALSTWEADPVPISQVEPHDIAIVFSGMTVPGDRPNDRVYFNKASDRILMAMHLHRIGKVKQILITGGKGSVFGKGEGEAQLLKQFLLLMDVPESDILIEPKADNTYQNALYTKEMLEGTGKSYLLITSAFHMSRCLACCRKVGLEVTPFPVDYYVEGNASLYDVIVPTSYAMQYWRILLHEWIGYFSYWITGKV